MRGGVNCLYWILTLQMIQEVPGTSGEAAVLSCSEYLDVPKNLSQIHCPPPGAPEQRPLGLAALLLFSPGNVGEGENCR